jgi:hypothetical protein
LTLSELPSGWTQSAGAVTHVVGSTWSDRLATCVGTSKKIVAVTPLKLSAPTFSSADKTLTVSDSVAVYSSAHQAAEQYRALDNAKVPTCMASLGSTALRATVQSEVGSQATVGTVAFSPLGADAFGPHATGFSVSIPLSGQGGSSLAITSTQVDFQVGNVEHELTFSGNGTSFPSSLAEHLIIMAIGNAPAAAATTSTTPTTSASSSASSHGHGAHSHAKNSHAENAPAHHKRH